MHEEIARPVTQPHPTLTDNLASSSHLRLTVKPKASRSAARLGVQRRRPVGPALTGTVCCIRSLRRLDAKRSRPRREGRRD